MIKLKINVFRFFQGPFAYIRANTNRFIFASFFLALLVVSLIIAALTIYLIRRHAKQNEKIARLSQDEIAGESCKDYQVRDKIKHNRIIQQDNNSL